MLHTPKQLVALTSLMLLLMAHGASAQTAKPPVARGAAQDRTPQEVFKALYAGNADRALELALPYLKTHPANVRMLVLAARAQLARDDHQAAYDLLERALAANPDDVDALYFMGIASGELAKQAFARVFTLAPDSARVHQLMARSLQLQQNPVEAAAEYEQALRADPNLVEALLEFGKLRREEGNCDQGLSLYERAEKVRPTYDGAYGLGVCLAMRGDHARAVDAFREALTLDPKSAAAHFGLGNALLQTGNLSGAVAALERTTQLAPAMRETYYVLGRAYQKMGQTERAQAAFARADALARAEREGTPAKIPR
jgi:tetratricopeptide (TPR) repeat protein